MQPGINEKAIQQIQKEFGIKEKKRMSEKNLLTRYRIESGDAASQDVQYIIKQASASATLSPFLRAVVVFMEGDGFQEVSFIEMDEYKLSKNEKKAIFAHSSEQMRGIKEMNATHFMDASWISKYLFEEVRRLHATNIHIVNIHHDYIRAFYQSPISPNGLLFHLLDKDFESSEEVIRVVKGGCLDKK